MDLVNAIGKVRFGSVKPQVVRLHKGRELALELLCMEPGQEFTGPNQERAYYVITGAARFTAGDKAQGDLPAGQLAVVDNDESHVLANSGEQRLICLVVRGASGR
jgi:mannose-6-phosphate isomerase-like protein (cupin superfamily)